MSAVTGGWADYSAHSDADEVSRLEATKTRDRLEQFLTDVLTAENLLVLAGLGTTLCLKASGKAPAPPSMADLWDAAATKAGSTFDAIKAKVRYTSPEGGDNIESLLSQCQLAQALDPSDAVRDFISNTEALIVARCRFVDSDTDLTIHEAFLRKVARRSTRLPRTKIFTTNYDVCFETAGGRARFTIVDGFSHGQPQEFDGAYFTYDLVRRDQDREIPDYIPNVFHLHKIHGSVDWELRDDQIVKVPYAAKPLIIYPRHSKFEASYNQPFIEMQSRFQLYLRQANTGVLVLGFGFNDAHIWQPLISSIRSNVSLKAVFVDPVLPASSRAPIGEIKKLIAAGDSRLVLVAGGFEQFVPILPDLVGATEEERHRERLRSKGAPR